MGKLPSVEVLIALLEEGKTVRDIYQIYGTSRQAVYCKLSVSGYSPKGILVDPSLKGKLAHLHIDSFRKLVHSHHSVQALANTLGVRWYDVKNAMISRGIGREELLPNAGIAHSAWKTGKCTSAKKYGNSGTVYLPTVGSGYDLFNPSWKHGHVAQHKYVMELEVLGCPLQKGFCCHHKNTNWTDNRSENLAYLSRAQHRNIHKLLNRTGPTEETNRLADLWSMANVAWAKQEHHSSVAVAA